MNSKPTQLLFIDATVDDIQTLLQGTFPGIEAHILSARQDGVAQITQILQRRPEVKTVHIISHGSPGCLYLGNSQLCLDTLNIYTDELQSWSRDGLTLILYGCKVAVGDAGEEFVSKLHQLTGANIAASVSLTGNENLGGNWNLEMTIGAVDVHKAITLNSQSKYAGILMSVPLTEDTSISLPGVANGSVAWGDYSGDGKLDLILTGRKNNNNNFIAKLYKNDSSGVLEEDTSLTLPGVYYSSVAWGDYSGDGKLDLILTGYGDNNSFIAKLYKNNGSGVLSEDTSLNLPGVGEGSVAWGDYSGDDKLDLILTGFNSKGVRITKLYKNDASGVLSEDTSFTLPSVSGGSVAWGDYSGDGKLDLILTGGSNNNSFIAKLYKNDGSSVLSEDTSLTLPGVISSSVAWGDYSGDGKLDLILTGYDKNNSHITKLYKNDGSGVLSEDTSFTLPGVSQGSVAWGDYSGDGKLDLILIGMSSNGFIAKLYKNNGSGMLSEDNSPSFSVAYPALAWGDYSGDGKLDLILTGYSGGIPTTELYKNSSNTSANDSVTSNTDNKVNNSIEEQVALEIAKLNPTDGYLKNLSQKAASDPGVVALFGLDGANKPIVIAINEQDQKQLGATSQTQVLVFNSVTTQRFNDAVPDPIAAFDNSDPKKSSLKKLAPVLDVINLEVVPNSLISEISLQQKIQEGIKQKPIRVEIKLPDELEEQAANTILFRSADGALYDFRRQLNPNRTDSNYDSLTGAQLQDRNSDGRADWAVVYLQDGAWGDSDGVVNGQIGHSLVAANLDFGTSRMSVPSSQGILSFYGNRSYVQFTLDSFSGVEASEVGMARVRFGADGQITEVNGKAVKSKEEAKQAIIARGETLFSSLSAKNSNPDIGIQTRTFAFEEGEQAVFFVIQNGTKDELLFKGLNSSPVKFSLPNLNNGAVMMTASNDQLGQTTKLSLAGLFDVSAKVLTDSEARSQLELLAIDQSQLGTTEESIDLKSSGAFDGKQVKLSFSLQREAAYNNCAYLYRVDDAYGSIRDPLTGMSLDPTSILSAEQRQRYLELATTERLVQGTELQASNSQIKETSVNLTGGEYYLPFLVSDGTLSTINKDFSRILTPYLGINSGNADHIRSLGNGRFGFEDLIGGGDRDYNDMILSIKQVQIIA